jgi:hypothetical protein
MKTQKHLTTGKKYVVCDSQTMDIVDMAIHRVVCQKSDSHGNSVFQNSQKLDPS